MFFQGVDIWNYQMLDLAERYRCIAVDLRGGGDSDKPFSDYTFEEWCADLRALIRHLELPEVALVGWSAGGGIALRYVLDFDHEDLVSHLVMVGAVAPSFTQTETEPFGFDKDAAAEALEGIRRSWPETLAAMSETGFHRPDRFEITGDWLLHETLKTPSYVAHKLFSTMLELDLRDRLGEVDIPTLILHGRHDQTSDPRWAEYMKDRIEGSKVVWLEESAHYPMIEEPDKLSNEIAAFVA